MSVLELLFQPIFYLIKFIFSIIPRIIFPENFYFAMGALFDLLNSLGFFIPLGTIATIGILFVNWYFLKLGLRLFLFVVYKIPFLNLR